MTPTIYLDFAAATPVDRKVLEAMMPYFSEDFYNPSALYRGARRTKEAVESARASVAASIGAKPSEIIFTAGGTESANLAIQGVMERHKDSNLIVSSVEHDAVLKPAQKYTVRLAGVDATGRVRMPELRSLIDDDTVLISIMYANNEVGTIQPLKEIVALIGEIRQKRRQAGVERPLYLHTDACQAPLYLDVNVAKIGVDLMTLNGGKMYGPKQSGVLYVRTGIALSPLILGGGQEFNRRSGTENVAYCVGFAKALEIAVTKRNGAVTHVKPLIDYFRKRVEAEFKAEINGSRAHTLPNNLHVTFLGSDNERMLFSLDDHGVYVAAGSACSASNDEPSHVLKAMGISDDKARSSIRFSIGATTTMQEIDKVLEVLKIAVKA